MRTKYKGKACDEEDSNFEYEKPPKVNTNLILKYETG